MVTLRHDDFCPVSRFRLGAEFCTCGAAAAQDDINAGLKRFGERVAQIMRPRREATQ